MSKFSSFESALKERAGQQCELCGTEENLQVLSVGPATAAHADQCILSCEICRAQLDPTSNLEIKHWFCLNQSIWSEVPAVQVVSWRLLHRLNGESWAQDLLDQAYLEESVMAWAQEGLEQKSEDDNGMKTEDSNGTQLFEGDAVTIIKDLDVKGSSIVAKRGTLVKGIRLTDNPEHIEGKVNKTTIVLKTCFLKKVTF
ncbi:MAG: PhnA domain-containing protein [Myxococcota bacterium]|nr:PhnA domain-containing protein [Myxococcota bacterium]